MQFLRAQIIRAAAASAVLLVFSSLEGSAQEPEAAGVKAGPSPKGAAVNVRVAQLDSIIGNHAFEQRDKIKIPASERAKKSHVPEKTLIWQEALRQGAELMRQAVDRLGSESGVDIVFDPSQVLKFDALVPGGPVDREKLPSVSEELEKHFAEAVKAGERPAPAAGGKLVIAQADLAKVRAAHPLQASVEQRRKAAREKFAASLNPDGSDELKEKAAELAKRYRELQKTGAGEAEMRAASAELTELIKERQKLQADTFARRRDSQKQLAEAESGDLATIEGDCQAAAEELFAQDGVGVIFDTEMGRRFIGRAIFIANIAPDSKVEDVTEKLIKRIQKTAEKPESKNSD